MFKEIARRNLLLDETMRRYIIYIMNDVKNKIIPNDDTYVIILEALLPTGSGTPPLKSFRRPIAIKMALGDHRVKIRRTCAKMDSL